MTRDERHATNAQDECGRTDAPNPLEAFSPLTQAWFRDAFAAPTRAQAEAWRSIASGQNCLVVAPTGSGKTLAAFLWAIDLLVRERRAAAQPQPVTSDTGGTVRVAQPAPHTSAAPRLASTAKPGVRVLYISPLKALGVDVQRNLRAPLAGIRRQAQLTGAPLPEISVGVRSGDTPPRERRRLAAHPPDILITTPESLYLMLTSRAAETLRGVHTVIVDEIHALADDKRGAHLALSLERLDLLLERPAQRIGLSATVRPVDAVARFLGGDRPVDVVAPPAHRRFDLTVEVPVDDMAHPPTPDAVADPSERAAAWEPNRGEVSDADSAGEHRVGSMWPWIERSLLDRVLSVRSTIVFTNSRRLAERLTTRLNSLYAERLRADQGSERRSADRQRSSPERPDAPVSNAQTQDTQHTASPRTGTPTSGDQPSDAPAPLARAHHGSVSKEQRAEVEEALKTGRLRCVVATSSLELGIDMGQVDLVVQIDAPPSVASALQRVGRAGHQIDGVSRAVFYPTHRAQLLQTAIVTERMLAGELETLHLPANPLDVIAQQTIAQTAMGDLDVEAWYDTVRRAAPFRTLPRSAYESVLDLVSGRYPSTEFAELRARVVWDRDHGVLTARPGAQRLAVTGGGTIPDRGLYRVMAVTGDEGTPGTRVGELDEEMVYESRVGDVFTLGTTAWRIREITHDTVNVVPAFGQPGRMPFWRGDSASRPAELGRALGALTRDLLPAARAAAAAPLTTPVAAARDSTDQNARAHPAPVAAQDTDPAAPVSVGADHGSSRTARTRTDPRQAAEARLRAAGLDDRAVTNAMTYLAEQVEATGSVPTDCELTVERTRDDVGDWRLVLESPYGQAVHAPWALAIAARIEERWGVEGSATASNDGIIVRVPDMEGEPPGADLFVFDPDEIRATVTDRVTGSPLFAARFRECSGRALLLGTAAPGRRSPLWQQRQRSARLLEVAARHPRFPMILETVRECLQDVYDLQALETLMRDIAGHRVRVREVACETPSPFARSMLFGYVGAFMYEGDQPLGERRVAALTVDPAVLRELLGEVELRDLLDAEAIAEVASRLQRLAPARRARDAEGVADLLRELGPLDLAAIAARMREPDGGDGSARTSPSAPDATVTSDTEAVDVQSPSPAAYAAARAAVTDLLDGRRAIRVRIAGRDEIAAIEDAALLRDGLGCALPPGVPEAFLAPRLDPLRELLLRWARTHPPFPAIDPARVLGLGPAVVTAALERLVVDGLVVRGAFRPDVRGDEPEYVHRDVLRAIRTRSLARLRGGIEPVPQPAYARFLADWQHCDRSLHGLEGVLDAVEQLAGAPLPASTLETMILPQRVADYRPGMLDELVAAGQVVWAGCGSLPGHDGRVSLHLADTLDLTLPVREDMADGCSPAVGTGTADGVADVSAADGAGIADAAAADVPSADADEAALRAGIRHVLADRGAVFARELRAGLRERGLVVTADSLAAALWAEVWAGLVTADSLAGLRALVAGGHAAQKTRRRTPVGRARRHGTFARLRAQRAALDAGPASGTASHRASELDATGLSVETDPRLAGRWSLLPPPRAGREQRLSAAAGLLLDRHGVVTRGAAQAEGFPGGFQAAYRVLAEFERAGLCRRGYLVDGLGGAQFAAPATVDRLREMADNLADAARHGDAAALVSVAASRTGAGRMEAAALTLSATDPASPWGAALDWPEPAGGGRTRPRRNPGALVTTLDGRPVLYLERGGRTLLTFPAFAAGSEAASAHATGQAAAAAADSAGGLAAVPVTGPVADAGRDVATAEDRLAAAASLADTVRERRLATFTITRIDGVPTTDPAVAGWRRALCDAGLEPTPRGLILRLRPW
jgi:ATP-dependent Lhr-like helicase